MIEQNTEPTTEVSAVQNQTPNSMVETTTSTEVSSEASTGSVPENGINTTKILVIFIVVLIVGFIGATFLFNFILDKKNEKYKFRPVDSNVTNETEINFDVTYSDCLYTYKKVFSQGDYSVFLNNNYDKTSNEDKEEHAEKWTKYYVLNTKKKILYSTFKFDNDNSSEIDNYLFRDYENPETNIGMFNLSTEKIIDGYDDYSCAFHSDTTTKKCDNTETTIISKEDNEKIYFGLLSLKSYSPVLRAEFDYINEIDNNFLVSQNNKSGLISSTGEKKLDIKYDYLGYNKYLGYIAISGNNLEVYDTKLDKVDLNTTPLNELYETAYTKYTAEEKENPDKYLFFANASSYYWSVGSAMQLHNLSEPFDAKEDNPTEYRYKYTGKKFKGEQLVINSLCNDKFIYVIQKNKATKIAAKEINTPNDEEGYCF